MKRKEVIKLAEEWLESVPDIRERIRLIDIALKKDSYDMTTIDKIKQRRCRFHMKLSRIIKSIGSLSNENQRIICYRYFEKLNYSEIARRVGLSHQTIPKRIKKELLTIGRIMFGFEDEFWNKVYFD